jgi:ankyrin repeat protein
MEYESYYDLIKNGDLDLVIKYINTGININALDSYKNSLLKCAAYKGYIDIVKLLLKHEAVTSYKPLWGHTHVPHGTETGDDSSGVDSSIKDIALHSAVIKNHYEIAKLLLSHKANANSFCDNGLTPLHIAAEYGNIDMLKLLIKGGGKVNILSKNTEISLLHSCAIGIKHGNMKCYDTIEWLLINYEDILDPFLKCGYGDEPRDILDKYDWSFAELYDDILEKLGYYINITSKL